MNTDDIRTIIRILTEDLPVDATGEINFNDSPFGGDQEFRLAVQHLYDAFNEI